MVNSPRDRSSLDALYRSFRDDKDLDALGALFDGAAPRLLGLARRLAGRRGEAEDWIQETFLTVLEKPESLPPDGEVMPWMLGILVNHARAGRRKSGRSPEQDRLIQREVEPPEAQLSAAEVRSAIEGAIHDLPPSQRSAVIGKLLDGRSSVELGRDLGLAPNAVRARLHRGLERMRAVLPAGLATGLFAWLSPTRGLAAARAKVLEHAGQGLTKASLTGSATSAAGATLLTKKLLAGGAALGLALLIVLGLRVALRAPEVAGGEALRPLGELASNAAEASPAPKTLAARLPRQAPPSPQASPVVLVTVLEASGEPALDKSVVLNLGKGSSLREVEGTTGPQGLARFELEPGTYLRSIVLPMGPDHPLIRDSHFEGLRAGETLRKTLTLVSGFSIQGQVVDDDGRPMPGASVLAWTKRGDEAEPQRKTLSADDGSFQLDHLGPDARILAQVDGMACRRGLRGAPNGMDQAEGLRIIMTPAQEIRGQVLLPDGRPAADVKVWAHDGIGYSSINDHTHVPGVLHYDADSAETTTDATGAFRLTGLASGTASVKWRKPPFLTLSQRCEVGDHQVRIVLDPGQTVSGQVFAHGGAPAAGAEIHWGPYSSGRHQTPAVVLADELGRFTVHGMHATKENQPWVGVSHGGHAIQIVQPIELGATLEDIHLVPEGRIGGQVVDAEGQPLANIEVQIRGPRLYQENVDIGRPNTWELAMDCDTLRTDEQGRFLFTQLYEAEFEVLAFSSRTRRNSVSVRARTGDGALEIELSEQALERVVIQGQVLDARTKEPIHDFQVSPFQAGRAFSRRFRDTDGRYRLTGLAPNSTELAFVADGYSRLKLDARSYDLGQNTVSVELYPSRSLDLSVVGPDGSPYSGASARFLESKIYWASGTGWSTGTSNIPKAGVRLQRLPARPLTLRVDANGATRDVPIDLSLDQPHQVEVRVDSVVRHPFAFVIFEATPQTQTSAWQQGLEDALAELDQDWFRNQEEAGHMVMPTSTLSLNLLAARNGPDAGFQAQSEPEGAECRLSTFTFTGPQSGSSERKASTCVFTGDLPAGAYTLRIESEAYEPVEQAFLLDRNRETTPLLLFLVRK